MLKNYFVIALRNLLRNKTYAAINIVGLAIGLACSFFLLLWVTNETSYDRFHADGAQIHQVWRHMNTGGQIYTLDSLPMGVAQVMDTQFPEVEDTVITRMNAQFVLTSGETSYRETGGHAGPSFFRMFTFPFIEGDPQTALNEISSIVITERTARKLFGDAWQSAGGAVGKTVTVDHEKEFTITGVMRDVPGNSTLQFDVMLPLQEFIARDPYRYGEWYYMAYAVYAKLANPGALEAFNARVADLFTRNSDVPDHEVFLQPFEQVHLHSVYRDGQQEGGRIEYVRIFIAVAVFILLIACINFMNLATARASRRAREVGVRKAIGANRNSLMAQFMLEAILMTLVAFGIALLLVENLLPFFNVLTDKTLTATDMSGPILAGFFGLALVVGFVSGSYPALYLSTFRPVAVLRGTFRQKASAATLRKGLVVFQFALSIILVVSTLTVFRQLDYILNRDLGLDRENLVYVPQEGALKEGFETVARELENQPGIQSVTASGQNPLLIENNNTRSVEWDGKDADNQTLFYVILANHDYVRTMGMELLAGRDFSRAFSADAMYYIVNEQTANLMGGDVIGKQLDVYGDPGEIVGVVKDFTMNSLYSPIEPVVIRFQPSGTDRLFVRTEPGRTREALDGMEGVLERYNPGYPIDYTFLDQQFEQTYRTEAVMGTLANVFAGLALFISCLGLFGLTSFTIEQRTREIGVRKVLGGSVLSILLLLTNEFSRLVLLANVIAWPVAYIAMERWLEKFAYRVDLTPLVFIGSGLIALCIAWVTVGGTAARAATQKPVLALRYE